MSIVLSSLWGYFVLSCVCIGGFWIQLGLWTATVFFDPLRRIAGRFYRIMAITCIKLMPSWDFRIVGPLPVNKPTGIVVSNHCSHLDAFLISHLPWEMKWLGKKSLFNIPFIGWSMRLAGDIPVVRGVGKSAKDAMAKAADYLRAGMPIMIFPEGTRSKDGIMLPFKDGAFRLAIENQVDILPIAVEGTRSGLKKGDWKLFQSHGRVTVGKAISTEGYNLTHLIELKEKVRAAINTLRDSLKDI